MVMALGKFEQLELRDYWPDEARDFTPWLASTENMEELSNIIGIDLEVEGTEVYIGSFKADIIAQDISNDRTVIIENQLEKTNHDHLGKLITYASGVNASIVIWICKTVTEEHRRAIDWLNENTSPDIAFFAIEIELWRIGDSLPAPRFNIISRPNEWTKNSKSVSKNMNLSGIKSLQLEFWNYLTTYFYEHSSSLTLRTPRAQHWFQFAIGRSKFSLTLTVNTVRNRIGCEIYMRGEKAKEAFSQLHDSKETIESALGTQLNWEELPDGQDSRIILFAEGNLNNRDEWPEMVAWFKTWSEKFYEVFNPRIKVLKL
jgi:murein DD-endopeptidase MepM/ murein hydrolase activator NlpD